MAASAPRIDTVARWPPEITPLTAQKLHHVRGRYLYCNFDGYPIHMLPALAPWTPEDILAAREIRQVRADEIDCFDPPRDPVILPRPTCQFCHLYVWQDGAWIELDPEGNAPEGNAE